MLRTAREIQGVTDVRKLEREAQEIGRCLKYAAAHMGCESGEMQRGMLVTYANETTEEQNRLAAIVRRIAILKGTGARA